MDYLWPPPFDSRPPFLVVVHSACPNAFVGIISNPVNSTVPIFCETLKKAGKLNPKHIFGVWPVCAF